VPNGARRGAQQGGQTGWLDGAERGARRGLEGVPNGARRGPDRVPNGAGWGARQGQTDAMSSATSFFDCHVIGHVIFECHVTRLGWQGITLLPTLVSQR
jgi:hypothetical protein